jgi:hypothetical protein
MKISKLLKMLLGLSGLFSFGVAEEGGGGALGTSEAAGLFAAMEGGGEPKEQEGDTPEARAEKLAADDLAAKDAPQDAGAAPEAADAKIALEVDGKTVELTRAELAEHYKSGMRQADYTKKTMEAADVRKTADAEVAAARQARQDYAQKLGDYAVQLQGALQEQAQTNWQELLETDPVEYLRQERIFNERQAALNQAQREQAHIGQQQQQEQAESANAYRAAQQQELLAKLPEWKDPEKAKAEAAQIKEYLTAQGFSAQKIESINDAAEVLMHRKAMLYDALIERAGKATKKVAALPTRVERPGNGDAVKPDGRTESMKRLAKSGSVNDAARVFSQMF